MTKWLVIISAVCLLNLSAQELSAQNPKAYEKVVEPVGATEELHPALLGPMCNAVDSHYLAGKAGELQLNVTAIEACIYGALGIDTRDDFALSKPDSVIDEYFVRFRKYWNDHNVWQAVCKSTMSLATSYGDYTLPQYLAMHGNIFYFGRLFLSGLYGYDIKTKPINSNNETMITWINRELSDPNTDLTNYGLKIHRLNTLTESHLNLL